ncbi:hypothetical protein [Microcoleus asticus]|nr:hypothetical protein [Microcoleus asticus]
MPAASRKYLRRTSSQVGSAQRNQQHHQQCLNQYLQLSVQERSRIV